VSGDLGGENTLFAIPPLLAFLNVGDFAATGRARGEPLEATRVLLGVPLPARVRVASGEVVLVFVGAVAIGLSAPVEPDTRRVGTLFTSCCARGLLGTFGTAFGGTSSGCDFF